MADFLLKLIMGCAKCNFLSTKFNKYKCPMPVLPHALFDCTHPSAVESLAPWLPSPNRVANHFLERKASWELCQSSTRGLRADDLSISWINCQHLAVQKHIRWRCARILHYFGLCCSQFLAHRRIRLKEVHCKIAWKCWRRGNPGVLRTLLFLHLCVLSCIGGMIQGNFRQSTGDECHIAFELIVCGWLRNLVQHAHWAPSKETWCTWLGAWVCGVHVWSEQRRQDGELHEA